MTNWYVHNGVDRWEGRYNQADAKMVATANGGTAVNGFKNVPQSVKDGQTAKEAQKATNRATKLANLKSQLLNRTNNQLSAYVDSKVTDPGTRELFKKTLLLLKDLQETR